MSRKRMQKLEKDSFTQKQTLFRIFRKTITFLLSLIVIQTITITIIIIIKKTLTPLMLKNQEEDNLHINILKLFKET